MFGALFFSIATYYGWRLLVMKTNLIPFFYWPVLLSVSGLGMYGRRDPITFDNYLVN